MNKKVSLKDIAKRAQVSIATVSYVLTKGENSGIGYEVSEKVKKIAAELNYRPNQIAQSLRSGKSYIIGLIVADISNPFFANIARIIEDEAKKHNYTVVFGSSDENATKSSDLINLLVNRQVDGFIIAPTEGSQEQIINLKKQNIPFVLIDRHFPEIESNYVTINNYKAAFDVTNRLLDTGNSDIGLIAYSSDLHHMKERIRGYSEALEAKGIKVDNNRIKKVAFSNLIEDVYIKVRELLSAPKPVTAIFFTTNTLAIHGLKTIDKLNLKVPNDISVVVFDAAEAFDFYYCPITHIKQPLLKIGKQAIDILVNQINTPEKKYSKLNLKAILVEKDSCK
ncbi:substrate-binding domain-containing protein [uncultured Polaribacter sp.]|uniref:LacI family DNA-binding transcriptional regulator n=1 Tax=uncultured Polaribacter sp. TaxID=174711 RepID=UPI00261DC734|nr:substrate-binding domain-containing protein [uncultured Polaribacter sp.]